MRQNLAVTQREFDFPADATLMSSTDTSSHIAYANEAFIKVSGFEREEIIGSPHNMVRHPDMPKEAFADMWATLKSGQSWTALVKNRRKDGDHYWVRANASPVVRSGAVVGYMSVRTKPDKAEVQQAESLYREFREGRAGSRAFHRGLFVHKGAMAQRSADAAKEIKQLIQASVEKVEAGTTLVDDAGKAMGDIVSKVAQVTDLIAHISQASGEQIGGIEQVNAAVSQLDDATQRNAGLVQQSSQSAASLQEQATRLAEAIAVFKTAKA